MEDVSITAFDPLFAKDFADLNYQWIGEYFQIEDHDREMLDDPFAYVVAKGGEVFFAVKEGEVLGTAAMIKIDAETMELAKMAVAAEHRGKGIADALLTRSIGFAREKGCRTICLESNTILGPAINLYRKYGFKEIPLDQNSPYSRANVRMELALSEAKM